MARYIAMYDVNRKNPLTKMRKNSNGPSCGCVIGFCWNEVVKKLNHAVDGKVTHICIDEWGIHAYHTDAPMDVGSSDAVHQRFLLGVPK